VKRRRPPGPGEDEVVEDDDGAGIGDDPSDWQPFWSYLDEMRKTGALDPATDMLVVQV
jgi:hypothetical protein